MDQTKKLKELKEPRTSIKVCTSKKHETVTISQYSWRIELAYEDFRDSSVILNNTPSFLSMQVLSLKKKKVVLLHIRDVVLIDIESSDKPCNYKSNILSSKKWPLIYCICCHWLVLELNRTILDCPLYRLQMTNTNNYWRIPLV